MKMMKAHYLLSISIQTDNMLQSKFKEFGWGCKSFHNKPCSDVVDFHSTINHRDHCREVSHDELDLMIKAQLLAHRFSGQHNSVLSIRLK